MNHEEEEVLVFLAKLDQFEAYVPNFLNLLSSEEKERSQRFQLEVERTRYIIRHGIFRKIISQYASIPLSELKIQTDENRKPFFQTTNPDKQINFSLSSSKNFFTICFGKNVRLGIDIEIMKDDPDFKGISKSFFSEKDNEILEKCPEEKKTALFLKIWTAKEAFIKANQLLEPDQFTIDFNQTFSHIKPLNFDNQFWHFYTPSISEEYIMTVSANKKIKGLLFTELNSADLKD